MSPLNKCHACGATAYAQVIKRDAEGVMRPTGVHQCVGCKQLFTNIEAWRSGLPAPAQQQSSVPTQLGSVHPSEELIGIGTGSGSQMRRGYF